MRSALIPVVLVFVLPALYLAWRLGLGERRAARFTLGAVFAAAVIWSLPYEGIGLDAIARIKLLLCLGLVLVLLARLQGAAGLTLRSRYHRVLTVAVVMSGIVYVNFFAFHGLRTFVHLHDVAHYYLGSKYYAELGYQNLYTAMLRAEAELYDNRFKAIEARDLRDYEQVHIRPLLQASEPIKTAFEAETWEAWKADVDYFRGRLGEHYGGVLLDHGFNPTPVWALVGGTLARLVPTGNTGILILSLLDVVLLAGLFAAVGWAFGRRGVLVALAHFFLVFGAGFSWTGGAYLRQPWFFGLVVGLACLKRRRDAAAGALFALATMLRVFPVFFAVPIVLKGLGLAWRHRRVPRRQAVFAGSFAATALALFLMTGFLPRGFEHWHEFQAQMKLYNHNISPNLVGLTGALAYQARDDKVTQEEFNALKARRSRIHIGQLLFLFVPALLLAARLAHRLTDTGTVALALPLLLLAFNMGSYYSIFLIVLVLWQRNSPRHLALLFAVEAASYTLGLFEDREGLVFIYRGLLLLFLYAAVFLPSIRREWKSLFLP